MKTLNIFQKLIFSTLVLLIGVSIRAMKPLGDISNADRSSRQLRPRRQLGKLIPKKSLKKQTGRTKKKRQRTRKQKSKSILEIPTHTSGTVDYPYSIEITDPENKVTIRLYKTDAIIAAMKAMNKIWGSENNDQMTINTQEESVKNKLNLLYKSMQDAPRVSIWFKNELQELQKRELELWNKTYAKNDNATEAQRLAAANKALKEYYGITTKKEIMDTKRALTPKEQWTIISHNFSKKVDQYIPDHAIVSTYLKPINGTIRQTSFIIPGELEYEHQGFTEIKPVAFTYTIGKKNNVYHRFADQFPKDARVEKILIDTKEFLRLN